jgi:hypothetical protein
MLLLIYASVFHLRVLFTHVRDNGTESNYCDKISPIFGAIFGVIFVQLFFLKNGSLLVDTNNDS